MTKTETLKLNKNIKTKTAHNKNTKTYAKIKMIN